jgi:endo-1,4-beta-D-glucanase Y
MLWGSSFTVERSSDIRILPICTPSCISLPHAANVVLILLAAQAAGCTPDRLPEQDWEQFRGHYIRPEGRLVDPIQNEITHSEGQGIALILATHYNDRATFDRVWEWTKSHLQVRPDRLLAWSWSPDGGVMDLNNATDGDLLTAWALARAGARWENMAYLEEAHAIARDIRLKLIRTDRRGQVLLPGIEGFEKPEHRILNLSYWIYPAFTELQALDPAPEWQELRLTGLSLLKESRFGRWGLPPDWIELGETPVVASNFPPRFGYDAVRIPLYLMWAGLEEPFILDPYRSFWGYFKGAGFLPAWTNLLDDSIDSHDAPPGIQAIARLLLAAPNRPSTALLPELEINNQYYSDALILLCQVMLAERNG